MRMGLTSVTIILVASAAGAVEQGDGAAELAKTIGPFVDAQTIVVGRVDVGRFDVEAIWARVIKSVATENEEAAKELEGVKGKISQWKQQFAKAGGQEICFVVGLGEEVDPSFCSVLPLGAGADAKALENLLKYGTPEAPEEAGQGRQRSHGPFGGAEAEVIRGALILAEEEDLARIREGQVAVRPELAKALAAGAGADVQIVVMPNEVLRGIMGTSLPDILEEVGAEADTGAVVEGFLWQSVGLKGPPKMSVKFVIQTKDEASAKATGDLLSNLFKGIETTLAEEHRSKKGAAGWVKLMLALKPVVEKDQLVLALNDEQTNKLVFQMLATSGIRARGQAKRAVSATNLRGIAMGCHLYANLHNGECPADLEELAEADFLPEQCLQNPRQEEDKGWYVYVRPAGQMHAVKQPERTILVYESYEKWEKGINVAFVDGHVEFIGEEKRFKELLEASWKAGEKPGQE